jgi:hypothetical protein
MAVAWVGEMVVRVEAVDWAVEVVKVEGLQNRLQDSQCSTVPRGKGTHCSCVHSCQGGP